MSTIADQPHADHQAAETAPVVADAIWPTEDALVKLRPGVELLTGADGRSMLFDAESGKYVFVSPGTRFLVPRLTTGVRYGVLRDELARRAGTGADEVDRVLRPLVQDLLRMTLLDGVTAGTTGISTRLARSQIKMPHVRLPISTERADRVFAAIARLFRGRAGAMALGFIGLLGAAGLLLALWTIFFVRAVPDLSMVWVLYVLMVPQAMLHEAAHGVMCRYYGVPAREVGVALWLYIMPIAYVDRSDSVRLERRWPRVAILLAGPVFDAIVLGVIAVLLLTGTGDRGTLAVLLTFQTVVLLMNFNLMLPTDGQQALENALGKLNLRSRAMTYVLHRVLRKPLPSSLARPSCSDRTLFWSYGVTCLAYTLLLFAMLGVTLYTLVYQLL